MEHAHSPSHPSKRRYRWDGWEIFVAAGSTAALVWFLVDGIRTGYSVAACIIALMSGAAVLQRKRYPLAAIIGMIVVVAVGAATSTPSIQLWVVAQLVLLSAALTVGRRRSIGYALAIGGALLACQVFVYGEPIIGGLTLGVFSWTLGVWGLAAAVTSERQEANEWEERARDLQRSRAEEIRRGIAEERLRIARDLHDELGHNIAAIGINAGAAEAQLLEDPERSRESLRVVRESSRNVLRELQHILGILRSDGDTPTPHLTVDELIDGMRQTGLQIVATPIDTASLAADGVAAAYRAVQEGLTNAQKHGMSPVTLHCHVTTGTWVLTISNPLRTPSPTGTGFGLIGMRERVELAGGRFRIEESAHAFTLHIALPLLKEP